MATDIPAYHPSQSRRGSRPLRRIQHVQVMPLPQSTNSSFTPVSKSGIYDFSSLKRRGSLPESSERTHPPHHQTKQLSSASALTRSQLSSARSFLSSHRKSSSVGPSYHACNCSLRDTSLHYPDSCHLPWQLSPVRLSFPFHILILTPEGLRQVPYRRS